LLLILPALVRARQRRRRLGDFRLGPRTDEAQVLADGAWAELCATARDLGISLPLRRSVRDIAAVLEPFAMTVRDPLQRLDDLVHFVERARYGRPFEVDPATRQRVVEAVEAWTAVLTDSVPAPRAWVARVFPRSVVDRSVQPTVQRQVELAGIGEVQ
jgi:hypothetical protein